MDMHENNLEHMVAAIYARKSVMLKKGDTLNVQEDKCRKLLNYEYEGRMSGIKFFTDEKTGKDMDRIQMQALIAEIKAGKVQVVCAYKLDRFGRNATDLLNFVELLKTYGVKLHCVEDKINYDPTDESDYMTKFLIMFLSLMAEMERNAIKQRVIDSKDALSRKGFWLGGTTPYGFDSLRVPNEGLIPDADAKYLYILTEDNDEIEAVDDIFSYYNDYEVSYADVANRCDMRGYKPRWAEGFDQHTIQGMLTNPVYVKATVEVYDWLISEGYSPANLPDRDRFDGIHALLTYGKTSRGDSTVYKENSDKIIAIAPHKGRIEAGIWLNVQRKILSRKSSKTKQNTKHDNVLLTGGIFKCACCGGLMSFFNREARTGDKFYPHYRCEMKRGTHGKMCNVENISATELDEAIIETVFKKKEEICSSIDYIRTGLSAMKECHIKEDIIPRLEREIKKIEQEINNYIEKLSTKEVSDRLMELVESKIAECDKRKEELRIRIEDERKKMENMDSKSKSLDLIASKLLYLNESDFNSLPMVEKRAIISLILSKVEWDGSTIHVYFKTPDDVYGGDTIDNSFVESALTHVDASKPRF